MKPDHNVRWLPCRSTRDYRSGAVLHAFSAAVGGRRSVCGFELKILEGPQKSPRRISRCDRCAHALASSPRARRLRRARQALGLSQFLAALRVGCDIRTYQRWEAGERSPAKQYRPAVRELLNDARWSQAWLMAEKS